MTPCLICATPFTVPKSAPNKSFCSASCRMTFHTGCMKYGQRQFQAGKVTIDEIKEAATR